MNRCDRNEARQAAAPGCFTVNPLVPILANKSARVAERGAPRGVPGPVFARACVPVFAAPVADGELAIRTHFQRSRQGTDYRHV